MSLFVISRPPWDRLGCAIRRLTRPFPEESQSLNEGTCVGKHGAIFRVQVKNRKVEEVGSLANIKNTGFGGVWIGLTPDNPPLFLQDTATAEIYSLDGQAP